LAGFGLVVATCVIGWFAAQSVAAACDLDQFRMLQKAIEDGGGASADYSLSSNKKGPGCV
jgi:hypothetical protein